MAPGHPRFSPSPESGRLRSNTAQYPTYVPSPGIVQDPFLMDPNEISRSRSSSWPRPPSDMHVASHTSSVLQSVQRSRSGDRTPKGNTGRKNADTPRKKRKRLNPQRRSFYKSLHNDFPEIADALREARRGADVVRTLKNQDIIFATIEARPPQDPTNLNVRRYNDTVFIWDPAMEIWLQAPCNGVPMFGFEDNIPPDFPLQRINSSDNNLHSSSDSHNLLVDRSLRSDTSTSEDEGSNRSRSGSMNGYLPT